jgi:hypothetical protein
MSIGLLGDWQCISFSSVTRMTERHKLQGIGGVVKLKHKKQVRVGEYAKLCRDEKKKSIQYL